MAALAETQTVTAPPVNRVTLQVITNYAHVSVQVGTGECAVLEFANMQAGPWSSYVMNVQTQSFTLIEPVAFQQRFWRAAVYDLETGRQIMQEIENVRNKE